MDWLSLLEENTKRLVASSGLRNSPCPFENSFPGPPVFLSAVNAPRRFPTLPIFLESLNFPSHNPISGHTAGWVTLEQGSAHPARLPARGVLWVYIKMTWALLFGSHLTLFTRYSLEGKSARFSSDVAASSSLVHLVFMWLSFLLSFVPFLGFLLLPRLQFAIAAFVSDGEVLIFWIIV